MRIELQIVFAVCFLSVGCLEVPALGEPPAADPDRSDAIPVMNAVAEPTDASAAPRREPPGNPDDRGPSPVDVDAMAFASIDSGLADLGSISPPTADMALPDAMAVDAMVVDAMVVDAMVVDAEVATCGNGQVEAGEECDDGNLVLEPCERDDVTSCLVCDPRCQFQDVLGPSCGDGIHQVHEACDPQANNLAAAVCTPRCTIGFMGGGGFGGSRHFEPPLTVQVDVSVAGGNEDGEVPVDLDVWVFHPNAVFESPLRTLDFAFSQASVMVPNWMGNSRLNEMNPSRLVLTIDGLDQPCSPDIPLRDRPGNRFMVGLAARDLTSPTTGNLLPATARITVSHSENEPNFTQEVQLVQNDDFYVLFAFSVCDMRPLGFENHAYHYSAIRNGYKLSYDPEP